MEKNENYWQKDSKGKPLPYLDRIILRLIPDPTTMISALEAGDIDYIPPLQVVSATEATRLDKAKAITLMPWAYANKDIYFIYYNMNRKITGNVKVRKALAHLVDANDIIDRVFGGYAKPVSTKSESFLAWFTGSPTEHYYNYNIEMAEKLLDEAGYPRDNDGKRFKIGFTITQETLRFRKIAEIMKTNFKRAGIEIDLILYDSAGVNEKVYKNLDFDLHLQTVAVGPDPYLLNKCWHSKNIGAGWITNASGYNNPKVDELFAKGLTTIDPKKRKKIYAEVQDILMDELPMLPILTALKFFTYDSRLGGFPIGYTFRESWENIYWKNKVPENRR
jgi:peptide/nickel transport system substrate-binding protein